ncbi:(2Fe-2S) ferredoxin domain-containing protein [Acidaminobacter sp. JC074]|uniref:(2Fe-2S) ferredoxin domain-containing protein n=1 Tax=Acidaminobacter sp. JC074 TaxID=2530199 RepID=UPI001F0E7696|nr:(2Fe-2S) ferredoxin domain-containing protein [Acidaminobacter sp. JC074]MCH4889051.1 (2Fe-2S) ferredoxin domain-containing protein [Acidaminobacter sp. JC074]
MKSLADLAKLREEALKKVNIRGERKGKRIVVGMATCGIAAGARPVLNALVEEISKRNLQDVEVAQTGCIGVCKLEPIVEVYDENNEKVTYVEMTPEKAQKVIVDHIVNGQIVAEYTIQE